MHTTKHIYFTDKLGTAARLVPSDLSGCEPYSAATFYRPRKSAVERNRTPNFRCEMISVSSFSRPKKTLASSLSHHSLKPTKTTMAVPKFDLLDGTKIPVIAWGNGQSLFLFSST